MTIPQDSHHAAPTIPVYMQSDSCTVFNNIVPIQDPTTTGLISYGTSSQDPFLWSF